MHRNFAHKALILTDIFQITLVYHEDSFVGMHQMKILGRSRTLGQRPNTELFFAFFFFFLLLSLLLSYFILLYIRVK